MTRRAERAGPIVCAVNSTTTLLTVPPGAKYEVLWFNLNVSGSGFAVKLVRHLVSGADLTLAHQPSVPAGNDVCSFTFPGVVLLAGEQLRIILGVAPTARSVLVDYIDVNPA